MWPKTSGDVGFYGFACFRGEQMVSSRFAYQTVNGSIPDGMMIRHKCDTPGCVNPWHLEPGTALDNERDKMERGRNRTGQNHPGAIDAQTAALASVAVGFEKVVAEQYGMSVDTLRVIKRGEHWSQR